MHRSRLPAKRSICRHYFWCSRRRHCSYTLTCKVEVEANLKKEKKEEGTDKQSRERERERCQTHAAHPPQWTHLSTPCSRKVVRNGRSADNCGFKRNVAFKGDSFCSLHDLLHLQGTRKNDGSAWIENKGCLHNGNVQG